MKHLVNQPDIFDEVVDSLDIVYEHLMDLVPEEERRKNRSKKGVLKFILDEVKRSFILKKDLLDPFKFKDQEGLKPYE